MPSDLPPADVDHSRVALARAVSTVGHPAVLLPAAILVASWRRGVLAANAGPLVAVVAAMLAVVGFLAWGTHRGRWRHIDVPDRRSRPPMYRFVLLVAGALLLLGWLLRGSTSPQSARGAAAALALLATASLVNRRLKISLHVALAVFSAAIAFEAGAAWFAVWLLLASAVAASRVILGRHSPTEIVAGAALGSIFGVLLHVP